MDYLLFKMNYGAEQQHLSYPFTAPTITPVLKYF